MTPDAPSLAEHQKRYSEAIHQARIEGQDTFQAWFNRSPSAGVSVIQGYWDFMFHILTPQVCEQLGGVEEKTVLEIGYGGGRLINAACTLFEHAVGIDIHNEKDAVDAFLRAHGKSNYTLLRTEGDRIPLDNNSLDFIYSFIVLQHLPSHEAFTHYIQETYRCLKSGGCAQLYYGRYSSLPVIQRLLYWNKGYKETPGVTVNRISLVVRPARVKALCREIGFDIIDQGHSYKRTENLCPSHIGGQNYVTLVKR